MGHLRVANLGKAYKRYPNRWSPVGGWLTWSRLRKHELIWVLRDVSFDIQPGEAVGIVWPRRPRKAQECRISE